MSTAPSYSLNQLWTFHRFYFHERTHSICMAAEGFANECFWMKLKPKAGMLWGPRGLKRCLIVGILGENDVALGPLGDYQPGMNLADACHRFRLCSPNAFPPFAKDFAKALVVLKRLGATTPGNLTADTIVEPVTEEVAFSSKIFQVKGGQTRRHRHLDEYPVPAEFSDAVASLKKTHRLRTFDVWMDDARVPYDKLHDLVGRLVKISFFLGFHENLGMRCIFATIDVLRTDEEASLS